MKEELSYIHLTQNVSNVLSSGLIKEIHIVGNSLEFVLKDGKKASIGDYVVMENGGITILSDAEFDKFIKRRR